MRIAIIGAGRLGRTLDPLLRQAGHATSLHGRGEVLPTADVVLLTVPDAAIAAAAATISPGPVILHTSGASTVDVLRPHRPAGSLHPVMTFPGPEVAIPDLRGVPAAVDGDPEAVAVASELARALGLVPVEVPGDRRLYHAAAVMAGNFATVLLAEAARLLEAAGVPADRAPSVLAPLAVASLRNAAHDPRGALTGPAARGDTVTIARHRDALVEAGLHESLALYDLMSRYARALAAFSAETEDGPSTPPG